MRLTRLYVERELAAGNVIELPSDAAAHVARVLRARGGDPIVLFNGYGGEYPSEIESVRGARVTAVVGPPRRIERESPLAVTLVQSVPRGDRMDLIVQKTVELGVTRIVPVISQRSVVRLDDRQAESKAAHWRGVAVSACEQCGRNRLARIDAPEPLLDHLGGLESRALPTDRRWVLEPEAAAAEPHLQQSAAAGEQVLNVHVAVGPEGGFATEELEAFRVAGFSTLALGPRVMRTETAAIAAMAWLQAKFGDM